MKLLLTNNRTDKLNVSREEPQEIEENKTIFRRECRRNKITPRFSKHKIHKNNRITVVTADNRKIHKQRIKKKRKFT